MKNDLKKDRIKKLKAIENAGFSVYPSKARRTISIAEAIKDFNKLSKNNKELFLVGRIMSIRQHGKIAFINIYSDSFSVQGLLRENKLGEKSYKFFLDNFDIGDFVSLKGILIKTKKGEKTIEIKDYNILAKSLLPLPDKWHGLQDFEERFRKRYLDILFNPEAREIIQKRAIFWNATREFLSKKGFLEVETPILEITPGGADAKPFITHYNALDIDIYLRISAGELWQKRLMVAGFEKTFEIGRIFRNEGISPEHAQDYTQMEFYWAYADHEQGMKMVEELYKYIIKKTFNTLKLEIKGFNVDFSRKWEKYDFRLTVLKYTNIDITEHSLSDMKKALKKLNIKYDQKGFNRIRAIDNLWKYCRKKIAGPGFLINQPIEISPLAKKNEKNPKTALKFQVIIAGSENGNGYSELNDPIDQAERFKEQQKLRDQGDEEAQMHDKDFVEALEHGMPPACGFGFSERLFSYLIDKPIRECQVFPFMKSK